MSSPAKSGGYRVGVGLSKVTELWLLIHRTIRDRAVKVEIRYMLIDDDKDDRHKEAT